MFNRALQVKMVHTKKNETEPVDTSQSYFEKRAEVISKTLDDTMKKVGVFAIGYIVIDTVRQVLVAKANRY